MSKLIFFAANTRGQLFKRLLCLGAFVSLSAVALTPPQASIDVFVRDKVYSLGQILTEAAANTVNTDGDVTVSSGADITYSAGGVIHLEPGFVAQAGSHFDAKIVVNPSDRDHNGLDDAWEVAHFGQTGTDPLANPSTDGLTNYAKYILGLDPNTSYPGHSTLGGVLPSGWSSLVAPSPSKPSSVAVGSTAGQFSVDKNGAAVYNLPFWCTPGTQGIDPKLSLSYSSQSGPGIAGFGWSISGLSSISRAGQSLAVDHQATPVSFDSTDRFYLNGQRLILVAGTYGSDGSEYRTEIESFSRIVAFGTAGNGPAWFRVWTKGGLIMEYGNTSDSRFSPPRLVNGSLSSQPEALNWALSRVYDVNGNYAEYVYSQDTSTGMQVLSRVNYTGHSNAPVLAPYASLRFEYENRTDVSKRYVGGAQIINNQRLKYAKAYYGETLLRTYTLSYTERDVTNRSLMSSIQETEASGTSFPAITFSYRTPTSGFTDFPAPPDLLGQDGYPKDSGIIDLNGDGLPDYIRSRKDGDGSVKVNGAWLNPRTAGNPDPTSWWAADNYKLPSEISLAYGSAADTGVRFVDINGDGLVDIIWGTTAAWLNTGSGWEKQSTDASGWNLPSMVNDVTMADVHFVDINGDGLLDIVWNSGINGKNQIGCFLNNANGTIPNGGSNKWVQQSYGPSFPLTNGTVFMDVNGDGLIDIVQHYYSDNNTTVAVAINTGAGWIANKRTLPGAPARSDLRTILTNDLGRFIPPVPFNVSTPVTVSSPMGTEIVDINGDGLPDLIFNNPYDWDSQPIAYLNTGNGWSEADEFKLPSGAYLRGTGAGNQHDSTGAALVDINGDGIVDVVKFREGESQASFWLGTGHGWGAEGTAPSNSLRIPHFLARLVSASDTGTDLVDLNGDGTPDVVWSLYTNNATSAGAKINTAHQDDRLVSVTNSLGAVSQITYSTITDPSTYAAKASISAYPNPRLIGPTYVVHQVSNEDGLGGQRNFTYTYGEMIGDALRGNQGFGWMKVLDEANQTYILTYYHQRFPYTGMVDRTLSARVPDGDGMPFSATSNTFDEITFSGIDGTRHYPFVSDSLQSSYDLGTTNLISETESNISKTTFDDYGNPGSLSIATSNSDASQIFTTTTANLYDNNAESTPSSTSLTGWRIGQVTKSTVTSTGPSSYPDVPSSITRTTSYLYDSADDRRPLKSVTVEPDASSIAIPLPAGATSSPAELTASFTYDGFGNKASSTTTISDSTVRTTNYSYDPSAADSTGTIGRFLAKTTNPLGYADKIRYDENLGKPTAHVDANDQLTSWSYDGFGRPTIEQRADSTHTYTDYSWSGTTAVPSAVYHVVTRVEKGSLVGGTPSVQFFDKYNRPIDSYTITGGNLLSSSSNAIGARISGSTVRYDRLSRAVGKSLPFYLGDTPLLGSVVSGFDALGRPLATYNANEAASGSLVGMDTVNSFLSATPPAVNPLSGSCYVDTTYEYSGLLARSKSRRLRMGGADYASENVVLAQEVTKNVMGWTVSSVDNSTGAVANSDPADDDQGEVQQIFDPLGELWVTRTRRGDGTFVDTFINYDIRGRKVRTVDGDMGTWTYAYDNAAELLSQKDNKANEATFSYDSLGRMTQRIEPEGTTTWTYDTSPRGSGGQMWKGKLYSTSAPSGNTTVTSQPYTEQQTYDDKGRPQETTRTIEGVSYVTRQVYDNWSNPTVLTYPNTFAVENVYNPFGFLQEIREASGAVAIYQDQTPNNFLYWQADYYDAAGRVNGATLGNATSVDYVYSQQSGRLLGIDMGFFSGIQGTDSSYGIGLAYQYDSFGNLVYRSDRVSNYNDRYTYDGLNRLTLWENHAVGSSSGFVSQGQNTFDALGNITKRTLPGNNDQSVYVYDNGRPHAVSAVSSYASFIYDANGNITSATNQDSTVRNFAWTSYNQLKEISSTGIYNRFAFDDAHQRVIQKTSQTTTHYVGDIYENVTTGDTVEHRYYIFAPTGRIAVRSELTIANAAGAKVETRFLHSDFQGSIVAESTETGSIVERYRYDAWGNRTISNNVDTGSGHLTRGYTDHEHLDDFGLIHMNARVYDPIVGRFLSPDSLVPDVTDSQSTNRYSYVSNNPLKLIDPSGHGPESPDDGAGSPSDSDFSSLTGGSPLLVSFNQTGNILDGAYSGNNNSTTPNVYNTAPGGGFLSSYFTSTALLSQGNGQPSFQTSFIGGSANAAGDPHSANFGGLTDASFLSFFNGGLQSLNDSVKRASIESGLQRMEGDLPFAPNYSSLVNYYHNDTPSAGLQLAVDVGSMVVLTLADAPLASEEMALIKTITQGTENALLKDSLRDAAQATLKMTTESAEKSGGEFVDLYRAVSPEEFTDIFQSGAFRPAPGGRSLMGKQFGHDLDEVIKLGDHLPDTSAVVRARIPKSVFDTLDHTPVDRHILRAGSTTIQPDLLDIFNKSLIEVSHAY